MMTLQETLEQVKVLLVEDNPGDARLVREMLKNPGASAFELTCVESLYDAFSYLTTREVDIILLDLSLPDGHGLDTLVRMKTTTLNVPIVILTGYEDASMALQAVRTGAQDYIPKQDLDRDRLLRVVRYAIERKRSEVSLRESDERFRALVQNATDIITILAADGTVLYESPSLEKVMGYSPEQVTGLNITQVIHPDDRPLMHTQMAAIIDRPISSVSGEFRVRHADGSWHVHESTLTNLLDQPAIRGIVVNSRDVTERRRSDNALRFQAQMLNTVGQAIIATDLDNKVTFWNRFAETLYGWSAEEAQGLSISVLTPADSSPEQIAEIRNHLRRHESWTGEIVLQRRDGTKFPALLTDTPILDEAGQMIGTIGISTDISERRQAVEALRQNEALLRNVLEVLPVGVMIIDPEGQITHVNRASDAIWAGAPYLGRKDYGVYKGWRTDTGALIQPEEWAAARVLSTGNAELNQEVEIECFDGSHKYILNAAVPMKDDRQQITGVIAVHQDMTERKQNEKELEALYNASSFLFKSDSLMNLAHQIVQAVVLEFDRLDCGLLVKEQNTKAISLLARSGQYLAPASTRIYDSSQSLIGQVLASGKLLHAPDALDDPRYAPESAHTGSELVIPLMTAHGVIGVLDLQSPEQEAFSPRKQRLLTAFAERAAAAIEVMRLNEELNRRADDLEWRIAARTSELSKAKERVETILNHNSDPILLLEFDLSVQQANRAFHRLLGYSMDDLVNHGPALLTSSTDLPILTAAVEAALQTNQTRRIEISLQHKDGTIVDTEIAIAPVVQYEGSRLSAICSIHDVTERKRAEKDLRAALLKEKELNELKNRFVSMVSHEFRTPLATIQVSGDLIRRYYDRMTQEQQIGHVDKIQVEVKRLTDMLNDVLDISRAETVGLRVSTTPTEMVSFCQGLAEEFQAIDPGHQISFHTGLTTLDAEVDQKLLHQAISNLLSNAVKYSPDGTAVELEMAAADDQIMIAIRDHGIGIPAQDQARLFETFFRAQNVGSRQGTGLGLAIVKQAIEAHHGTIEFESLEGQGTTLRLRLPIQHAQT